MSCGTSATAREIVWLQQLQKELGQELSDETPLYCKCDNQSAIKFSLSDAYRPRTKHIDIRHHYIRELIEAERIRIEFASTNQMAADALTKSRAGREFAILRQRNRADQLNLQNRID